MLVCFCKLSHPKKLCSAIHFEVDLSAAQAASRPQGSGLIEPLPYLWLQESLRERALRIQKLGLGPAVSGLSSIGEVTVSISD